MKVKESEVSQYYFENSHPAIIDPNEWDMVQAEFIRRCIEKNSSKVQNQAEYLNVMTATSKDTKSRKESLKP